MSSFMSRIPSIVPQLSAAPGGKPARPGGRVVAALQQSAYLRVTPMNASTLPRPDPSAAPELLRHLPSIGVIGGIVALFASVGSGLPALQAGPETGIAGLEAAPGEPPLPKPAGAPTALVPISADEAARRNAALPVENGPNPAATSFTLPA